MSIVDVNLNEASVTIPTSSTPKEMISVRTQEDGKTVVKINSSSLSILQECQRKAKYSLVEKWKPESESPATLFGTAIHKALEVFYTGRFDERKMPEFEQMELMSYGHKIPNEETDLLLRATRAFIAKAKPLEALPESDKRSIQNGVFTLWHYFKAYINDPYIAYVDERGPFIEREVSFVLHEDTMLKIIYFGTIDIVLQHKETGEILVADHKTSSVVGAEFYNRLKPNHQYTGYLMGVREVYNLNASGFLVNCIQVKEKPKTSRGTPPHFPRQVTTRDADDFEEFRTVIKDAVNSYMGNLYAGNWPMGAVNACATYGGCSFLSICSAPKSMREPILRAKFKQQGVQNEIK